MVARKAIRTTRVAAVQVARVAVALKKRVALVVEVTITMGKQMRSLLM